MLYKKARLLGDIHVESLISIQAFCLPVIQVVYETIQDALSGKKSGKVLIDDEGDH
jgi:hypothetical protein